MKLKRLEIHAPYFGNDNTLTGQVQFEGTHGDVALNLTQEQVVGIMAVVADAMVFATKELAEELTANIIEVAGRPQLENKE